LGNYSVRQQTASTNLNGKRIREKYKPKKNENKRMSGSVCVCGALVFLLYEPVRGKREK